MDYPSHSAVLRAAALSYYPVFGSIGDVVLLTSWFIWKRSANVVEFLQSYNAKTLAQPAAVAAAVTALVYAVFRYTQRWLRIPKLPSSSSWTGPARPLLFPCRTTHTRMVPKKHSFSYSYLLVGIPVGWSSVAGGMISADTDVQNEKGWYTIDAADYLERGGGHLGLRGKLDQYLESQGVDPSKYPYAYLATAAKFLGYHFNPASFWYLYSADLRLAATIIEVNNTFDERRMYFLTPKYNANGLIEAAESYDANGTTSQPLRQTWQKDFHVSPFNSRKGAYSLIAHDPLFPSMKGAGFVDSTINLLSSQDQPKLVARIFSEGEAIDPTEMTVLQKALFLGRWWWVGFVTFPRIVREAAALFFKRKLHIWYRPEPLKQSIGRHADDTERQLESIFRGYLRYLVDQSPAPLAVGYIPSGMPDASTERMMSASAKKDPRLAEELEFKVLTPAFYSRFVCYAHDLEAMFCELHESSTVWVSKPDLLPKLVFKKPAPPLHTASYIDYGYFTAIKSLRQRPERIERPLTSSQTTTSQTQKDIRGFRLSSMDGYVLSHEDSKARRLYRHLVLKLFLADRIAMGSMDILWLEHFICRMLLAWVMIS